MRVIAVCRPAARCPAACVCSAACSSPAVGPLCTPGRAASWLGAGAGMPVDASEWAWSASTDVCVCPNRRV
eukprot:1137638-Pelagomonas_calceolata.AAC.4